MRLAVKNYSLWRVNPNHPSLRFRRLEGRENLATVRVGDQCRALGLMEPGIVVWIRQPDESWDRAGLGDLSTQRVPNVLLWNFRSVRGFRV